MTASFLLYAFILTQKVRIVNKYFYFALDKVRIAFYNERNAYLIGRKVYKEV